MISKESLLIKAVKSSNQPILIVGEGIEVLWQALSAELQLDGAIEFSPEDGVEQLRQSIADACVPSLERKNKILLIKQINLLSSEQVNTLLKILEEPPSHLYIILQAKNLSSVMLTVRSRCKVFIARDKSHDREVSILNLLELTFQQYVDHINKYDKNEFLDLIAGGLEVLKKRMLNRVDLTLYKKLAKTLEKVTNTNVNYKLLAEDLYFFTRNK